MKELREIIAFRFLKSAEAWEEALLIKKISHWNMVANRLYYSAFYAVSALLLQEGVQAKSHSGIKSKFNDLFIRSGLIDEDFGNTYNELFHFRQEGDYADFVTFSEEEIRPLFSKTEALVQKIKEFVQQ